ncbi:MAG: hypothetical protein CMB67_04270 [Euryarchaeota archaeon]|nr:hypothetical protein [Euryarchaeota archaeon]
MERALSDLIEARISNFMPKNTSKETHGFTLLGIADSVPDIEKHNVLVHIWHVPKGILPITPSEVTRWDLDSPGGFHWILSERPIHKDLILGELENIEIWGPDDLSLFLGRGVMDGDLVAQAPINELEKTVQIAEDVIPNKQIQSLRTVVNISTWKIQMGMEEVPVTPILLEGRIWRVEGEIIGPNGEIEFGRWDLLEDPWSSSISEIKNMRELPKAPDLRLSSPPNQSWLSEDELLLEAAKILDVRRRSKPSIPGTKEIVRSMLLQRWKFNKDSASCKFSPLHIPGWIIHSEMEQILHGRNGRLYEA